MATTTFTEHMDKENDMTDKVFVIFDGDDMTDVIVTDDVLGPRDQATLEHFFSDSPASRFVLATQTDSAAIPDGCKWWPSLNDYMEQFGVTIAQTQEGN